MEVTLKNAIKANSAQFEHYIAARLAKLKSYHYKLHIQQTFKPHTTDMQYFMTPVIIHCL